jgi:nucleotide-binding universal stress UspA family protein
VSIANSVDVIFFGATVSKNWVRPIGLNTEGIMLEHLLLAIDASEHSQRTRIAAQDLAKSTGASVRVLHVRDGASSGRGGPVWHESQDDATLIVNAAVGLLQEHGVEVSGIVRDSIAGATAREIIDEARESQASMIVMGSRGHSEFSELLIGSVAHKVLNHSTISVLLVR